MGVQDVLKLWMFVTRLFSLYYLDCFEEVFFRVLWFVSNRYVFDVISGFFLLFVLFLIFCFCCFAYLVLLYFKSL